MPNTPTPNMNLVLPTPSVDPGPQYAVENNTAFTVVDGHNHTPGSGAPILTASISINADLPLNNHNLILIRSSRYVNQTGPLSAGTDLNICYVQNGNLYYVDNSGNQIQITAAGAVNTSGSGNITGMGGTSAVASYSSGSSAFTFISAANTPANFNVGPISIGLNSANSKTVTLTPPSGLSANYTLVFPTGIAVSTNGNLLSSDTSGNLGYLTYDAVGQGMTSVGADAVAASMALAGVNSIFATSNNANLPGTAVQAGGKNLVVSNTNASTDLCIVRGQVNAAGSVVTGEGFTCSLVGQKYNITFTTPFSAIPVVVGNVNVPVSTESYDFVVVQNPQPSTVTIFCNSVEGVPDNAIFSFIAIGPR